MTRNKMRCVYSKFKMHGLVVYECDKNMCAYDACNACDKIWAPTTTPDKRMCAYDACNACDKICAPTTTPNKVWVKSLSDASWARRVYSGVYSRPIQDGAFQGLGILLNQLPTLFVITSKRTWIGLWGTGSRKNVWTFEWLQWRKLEQQGVLDGVEWVNPLGVRDDCIDET